MNLLIAFRSEIIKTKRTSAYYLTIGAAAFAPVATLLDILLDEDMPQNNQILSKLFIEKFQINGGLVLPIFMILIATLLSQTEYKNNAWKQVLTSPQTKANVFLSKFINLHFLIVVFLITNQFMVFLNAVAMHFKYLALNVLNQPIDTGKVVLNILNSYIALLALGAIQFWLGLRFRNFIIPIAIGIAGWFTGTILVLELESPFAQYFPCSFHAYSNFPQLKPQLEGVLWTSAGIALLFLIFGFMDFKKRRMNG